MNEQQTGEAIKKAPLPILKLLIIITDRDKAGKIAELLTRHHVHHFFKTMAQGTASSEILDYLGIGSSDKAVMICLVPQQIAKELLIEVGNTFMFSDAGKGIGFTMPLSGISRPGSLVLNEDMINKIKSKFESEVEKMKTDATHDLILAIINQGYSEDLMEAAKSAGATGGTVTHARRLGDSELTKYLGVPIQAEKEIVMILTTKELKMDIMKAANSKCGLTTEAQGIVFSLPVDGVVGVRN